MVRKQVGEGGSSSRLRAGFGRPAGGRSQEGLEARKARRSRRLRGAWQGRAGQGVGSMDGGGRGWARWAAAPPPPYPPPSRDECPSAGGGWVAWRRCCCHCRLSPVLEALLLGLYRQWPPNSPQCPSRLGLPIGIPAGRAGLGAWGGCRVGVGRQVRRVAERQAVGVCNSLIQGVQRCSHAMETAAVLMGGVRPPGISNMPLRSGWTPCSRRCLVANLQCPLPPWRALALALVLVLPRGAPSGRAGSVTCHHTAKGGAGCVGGWLAGGLCRPATARRGC